MCFMIFYPSKNILLWQVNMNRQLTKKFNAIYVHKPKNVHVCIFSDVNLRFKDNKLDKIILDYSTIIIYTSIPVRHHAHSIENKAWHEIFTRKTDQWTPYLIRLVISSFFMSNVFSCSFILCFYELLKQTIEEVSVCQQSKY
jgi:hypothetical protein